MCLNPKVIKGLHEKYEEDWFEEYQFSTVVIKKKPGYFSTIDLTVVKESVLSVRMELLNTKFFLNNKLNRYSLRLFDEVTNNNYGVYNTNGLPNVVVLIDTIHGY